MKKLKRYQYERYAILCQLAYDDEGFDVSDYIADYMAKFNQITLCDKYHRTGVRVLWSDSKKEVIVLFRGSLSVQDWLGNLCFFPDKFKVRGTSHFIHWGFKRLLNQPMYACNGVNKKEQALPLRDLLLEVLQPLQKQGKRFSFIGHSSGGAIAVLLADMFEREHAKSIKRVVTFGQPAAGTRRFYKSYLLHNRTYRICCDLDIVTFMPPIPFYFWHVGKMLWLHDDRIYENTPTLKRFIISLKSWLLRPFTYHLMRKYIRNKSLFDNH